MLLGYVVAHAGIGLLFLLSNLLRLRGGWVSPRRSTDLRLTRLWLDYSAVTGAIAIGLVLALPSLVAMLGAPLMNTQVVPPSRLWLLALGYGIWCSALVHAVCAACAGLCLRLADRRAAHRAGGRVPGRHLVALGVLVARLCHAAAPMRPMAPPAASSTPHVHRGHPAPGAGLLLGRLGARRVPTAVQMFAWLGTLAHGKPRWDLPMLYIFGFFFVFVLGGLTGVMLAIVPFDWQAHDTYFVVAHLHYVVAGAFAFPLLAALYYWLPLLTGRKRRAAAGGARLLADLRRLQHDLLPHAPDRPARHAAAHLRLPCA